MALNKADVIAAIAEKSGLTKVDSEHALNAFQEVLVEALSRGETVKLTGLLTIERKERAARTGRNPRTGEPLEIAAGHTAKVTVGSALKKAASGE